MSCATELLHPANFCPVCGARLAAPPPDGTAATLPGNTPPVVAEVRSDGDAGNVVYLTEEHGIAPGPPAGTLAANPRANDYDGVVPETPEPVTPAGPSSFSVLAAPDATLPPGGEDPFGDFFADGPSTWLEEDAEEREPIDTPRILGSLLGWGALCMFAAAWVVWAVALVRGKGGAEAGGFILLWIVLWSRYLTLSRRRQHAVLLRLHGRLIRFVDRRVMPLQARTEEQLALRRERDRQRAMRDERARRVGALGEAAYRAFRQGVLPAELHPGAQRLLAIEQQMLLQDERIRALVAERDVRDDAAAEASSEGHTPA